MGLSTQVWTVQVGVFLSYLAWGAVLPFEIIYLHDGRGFGLGAAWSSVPSPAWPLSPRRSSAR